MTARSHRNRRHQPANPYRRVFRATPKEAARLLREMQAEAFRQAGRNIVLNLSRIEMIEMEDDRDHELR